MSNEKRNGRDDRSKRGSSDPRRRRAGTPWLESLEDRRLLTSWVATSSNPYDVQNGPLAPLGATLIGVYQDFVKTGASASYKSPLASTIYFKGASVGVDVQGSGDFTAFQQSLKASGMAITTTLSSSSLVEGYIPIGNLPNLVTNPLVTSIKPSLQPLKRLYPYQGLADNEGPNTLNIPLNVQTGVVNGTGQTIGVLSDSVSEYAGGLADSVKTGDLPSTVQVLQDDPAGGGTDEGRAILEEIHDAAPGAQLGFATADGGDAAFASNIEALATAGYKTIDDDIGYPDEPFYQDGTISQAVNAVTAEGVTYVSSAGNSADDGYESQFRGVNATVGSLGAGRYQNFDGSGATTTTELGVYVPQPEGNGAPSLFFQFDQPFQSTSTSAAVTSDVAVYLLNSSGAVVYSGVTNTIAANQPFQALSDGTGSATQYDIAPGTYSLVVKVISGATTDPGHIVLYNPTDGVASIDHSLGSAGGTYYPTTLGHAAAANTIGVGAVPFFGVPLYSPTYSYTSEPFSSFGPVLSLFNPDGSPKTAQVLDKPDISAPDDVNTSFFSPGQIFSTTQASQAFPANPEYPGNALTTFANPNTTVNVFQTTTPQVPSFSGTSAAAPNIAAVVALMKQADPSITHAQIVNALISTATPLNLATKGTWNPQGGYGLANATAAIAASASLQVNTITPGSAQTITQVPSVITVTFSQPVNLATLSAASLIVTGANGASVTVGAPVGVDSATFPTVVNFPILITPAAGRVANGIYTVTLLAGGIKSETGTAIKSSFTTTFNLQDTVAPTVVKTTFVGRVATLTFSGPVNPATINPASIYIFRAGGVNNPLFNPADVVVSAAALGGVLSYNATTFTVTVDLTNVSQLQLPTDHYALVAMSTITDAVGNPLNGAFNGVFPSGVSPSSSVNFIQDLGVITLQAPLISTLVLSPGSDTGVVGDSDTNVGTPSFTGQITALFPATNVGVTVYAQFNGIAHTGLVTGGLNLGVGTNGRGIVGQYDAVATTNATGGFVITYPAGVSPLPEGQNIIRAVVVGKSDATGLNGLSSVANTTFIIDRTAPYVGSLSGVYPVSVPENGTISTLSTLSFLVVDPVNPTSLNSPFAVNAQTKITALNPATADNTANYNLYLRSGTSFIDESQYITGATFVPNANFAGTLSPRVLTSDPFTGRIDVALASGLPEGSYLFFVRGAGSNSPGGVTDQAGNSITSSAANSASGVSTPFATDFNLQPTPTYITNYDAFSAVGTNPYAQLSLPRASYEIPATGVTPGAPAPPTAFTLDFSNQLSAASIAAIANDVQLVRSANSATSIPDGDFGNFGTAAGLTAPTGFTQVSGLQVFVVNSVPGAVAGQAGYLNRILVLLANSSTLPADYYRIYLPNTGTRAITDIYGNQLDGEFLGYQNSAGKYVDTLDDGTTRGSGTLDQPDLTGDGVAGGAFVTGFVVVPNGNVIYARPDAVYNPQLPASYPDGTQAKPYPVLAPEATYTALNNGDLNSVVNSGVNFNTIYDRSGLGTFQPSAFFAAQEKARLTQDPVVIVAEPAYSSRNPFTGVVTQQPFVLQAPAGGDPVINDGSAAIPAMTTLIFAQGSTLKMENASLLVQNQGSSLQIEGGPNPSQIVNITSYKDSTIGGATNGDASQLPASGDYGGILFRNYNQAGANANAPRISLFPGQIPTTGSFASDGRLKGPFTSTSDRNSQLDAVSGADPIMSYVNFLVEKYAGGTVPQTLSNAVGYDGITMQNSRPTIVNTTIADAGVGSAQAGLSVDVDSLLKDDNASGPLLRADTFVGNNLNGIYVRAQVASGLAEATTATNLTNAAQSYALDDPYPYILQSVLTIGSRLIVESGGSPEGTNNRLYVNPGMLVKFQRAAGINVLGGSINVGDTTYIREYDTNTDNPALTGFKANSALLANALFTSYYDDTATTTYTDPVTGVIRTVVAPLTSSPSGAGANQPTVGNVPTNARWGGIAISSGVVGVINSATIRFGGGEINTATGTGTEHALEVGGTAGIGARISVTNNTFDSDLDVPINLATNAIYAGDPTRPLRSGDPFIHGNTFVRNTYNAVGVVGGTIAPVHPANLLASSTWTGGDYTYLLRDTIVVGPAGDNGFPPTAPTTFGTLPTPNVTLTLQSTLPGTVLADGTVVAAPGIPLVIKTMTTADTPPTETPGVTPSAANQFYAGGAGFIVGVDNGIDPPTPLENYVDNGLNSQIRILGIPGNQSTNQVRVPVTITSIHDTTIGTVSNGVTTTQVIPGDTTAAQPGDGGVIYFGGNSLTTYDFEDTRNGSVIDNADIRYMTRIEQQGGGILYTVDVDGDNAFTAANDLPFQQKYGTLFAQDSYNSPKKLTISDSNLADFSDGGVVAHPGFDALDIPVNYTSTTPYIRAIQGEPTETFLVNDTISGMQEGRGSGLEVQSEIGDDAPMNGVAPSPSFAIVLNTTFYNNKIGINAVGAVGDGNNVFSAASILAMDDIFDDQSQYAITGSGQVYSSESEYSLFNGNGVDVNPASGIANNVPYSGDPAFRDAANGNFNLTSTSAAIDRSRSELGPSIFGDVLYPSATINLANLNTASIRNTIGNTTIQGGYNPPPMFRNTAIVTLPGEPVSNRLFPDQWVPTLVTAPAGTVVLATNTSATTPGTAGNGKNVSTYSYKPLEGVRDLLGNLRVPDPGTSNQGSGSRTYFDLGAYEYIVQNPPLVENVSAVSTAGISSNLYVAGGIAGTNAYPSQIRVGISERLSIASILPSSVMLIGSGGDGIFGNANDINYNLANRLSFDNTTDTLIINTAGLLPTGTGLNDEYELILKGSGSSVLRDNNGLALDGYTKNNTLPLPSGSDDFPGSDFSVMFTIDTNPPSIVSGTFFLAPGSYKTAAATAGAANVAFPIIDDSTPTFVGTVTDIFPPANPVQGDQVFVDISTNGDPNNFNILGAATGVTNANGTFSVTVTNPLPNTPFTVGADGIQGTKDDTGVSLARVRVVDQAGNTSLLTTSTFAQYVSAGSVISYQLDTTPPQVLGVTPNSTSITAPNSSGQIVVTATFSKNIDPTTLNANSVLVTRSGGTGTFTNGGIAVPIVAGSFAITYLHTPTGDISVSFTLQSPLPNDFYRVTLKGTGTSPIRDVAGNALDGLGTGVAGSGDYTTAPISVFTPANSRLIYVGVGYATTGTTAALGSRFNPYTTIQAGINAANTGDVVLVLPGNYYEQITLKGQVRVLSADPSSTDASYLPGNPLATVIDGNTIAGSPYFNTKAGGTVVTAGNIANVPGIVTEISGFTILSPLLGDAVHGFLDPTSIGVELYNSDVLVDKNYIINAGIGINIATPVTNATGSQILSNVIAGNSTGVGINDLGVAVSYASPIQVINNTIVDNTYGLVNVATKTNATQAYVLNDIFYGNHDLTSSRTGTGILSIGADTLNVGSNLFYANGVSGAPSSNASGTFLIFNPAFLSAKPDGYGNILGNPAFVSPLDPRPNGDTNTVFFNSANYDLTSKSPAINEALNSVAPATDILYRKAVAIAGHGMIGTGPASIGAFYYMGTGAIVATPGNGLPTTLPVTVTSNAIQAAAVSTSSTTSVSSVGGSLPIGNRVFAVSSTSLNPDGVGTQSPGVATSITAPTSIVVDFTDNVIKSSITASDLILSGSGVNAANPAKATSLTWVDNHTVKFLLTGGFNPTGAVNVSIPAGSIQDSDGDSIAAFAESFQLAAEDSTPDTTSSASQAVAAVTSIALPIQPVAVAGPIAVHYTKHKVTKVNTAKAHAAATAKSHKKQTEASSHTAKQHAAKAHAKHGKATK